MNQFDFRRLQDGTTGRRTDLQPRDVRALTECMTVLPEGGDIYTVVGENGGVYTVDGREKRCTCPDHKHRDVSCKHIRRVAYATGERQILAWVETDDVDAKLGEHVDATLKVVATDGGAEIVDGGVEGEVLIDDEHDDGRPDDCDCGEWKADLDIPCWPCYLEGIDGPASAEYLRPPRAGPGTGR